MTKDDIINELDPNKSKCWVCQEYKKIKDCIMHDNMICTECIKEHEEFCHCQPKSEKKAIFCEHGITYEYGHCGKCYNDWMAEQREACLEEQRLKTIS